MADSSKVAKNGDTAALAKILELTEPHVPAMIEALVKLANTSKRESVRLRAASKLLELHLAAAAGAGAAEGGGGQPKVVVVREADIDRLSEIQRLSEMQRQSSQPKREAVQATAPVLDIQPPRLTTEQRFGRGWQR